MQFEKVHRCKQCEECRQIKRQEWATRIEHEASLYPLESVFITLTYAPEYLPTPLGKYAAGTLCKEDMQKFWKRLRKNNPDRIIRYFQVGEYGTKSHRPHYHAMVFGMDPSHAELEIYRAWSEEGEEEPNSLKEKGIPLHIRKQLKGRKFFGGIDLKIFNKNRAGYITGYSMKKQTTKNNFYRAHGIDGREPEFMSCSKGVGLTLADKVVSMMHRHQLAIKDHPETNHYGEKAIWIELPRYLQEQRKGKVVNSLPLDETLRKRIVDLLQIEPEEEFRTLVVGEMLQNYEANRPRTLLDAYNDHLREVAEAKRAKKKRRGNLIHTRSV